MKCNLAIWDRLLRFIFGVILLTYAIAGGPYWAYFGAYLILSSAWGICAIYSWLRIKSLKEKETRFSYPPVRPT